MHSTGAYHVHEYNWSFDNFSEITGVVHTLPKSSTIISYCLHVEWKYVIKVKNFVVTCLMDRIPWQKALHLTAVNLDHSTAEQGKKEKFKHCTDYYLR